MIIRIKSKDKDRNFRIAQKIAEGKDTIDASNLGELKKDKRIYIRKLEVVIVYNVKSFKKAEKYISENRDIFSYRPAYETDFEDSVVILIKNK